MTTVDAYDDIIVGAGSAGAAHAARLSEDPDRRVLLIEAGPDYRTVAEIPAEMIGRATSDATIEHDWRYTARATAARVIEYPAGKVTGGGSAVNSAVALRGAPADYDEWAYFGNRGWSWQDVLPYFMRLEHDHDYPDDPVHGSAGPLPIIRPRPDELLPVHRALRDAALALGHPEAPDLNRPGAIGAGPWPMNVHDGIRISTALAYLNPDTRQRPNLTIRSMTTARRIIFRALRRVTGVEVDGPAGRQTVTGERVTLAAGAIGTPAILLRSGIGAASHVHAVGAELLLDRPGVGEQLLDHPFAALFAIPAPGVCDLDQRSVQIGLRYTASGSLEDGDMQLLIIVPVDLTPTPTLARRVGAHRVFMIAAGLQRPHSRGRTVPDPADPLGRPTIELNLASDRRDVSRLADGVRLAWQIAQSDQMRSQLERIALIGEAQIHDDDALADYVRAGIGSFKHPTGTARMAPESDPMAVVDADCRVHGVSGLRIADASIMPNIPRANPNLTCIMIGERVADLIRGPAAAPAPLVAGEAAQR